MLPPSISIFLFFLECSTSHPFPSPLSSISLSLLTHSFSLHTDLRSIFGPCPCHTVSQRREENSKERERDIKKTNEEFDFCSIFSPIFSPQLSPQLRSSFKQAFSKKKSSKLPSSQDDIDEMTDSSLPSSPKLQHASRQGSIQALRASPSTTE